MLTMKVCTVCKVEKDFADFFVRDKSNNRMHSQCKACYKDKRKAFMADHYKKYGDQYRERARVRKLAIKKLRQEQLYDHMKGKACEHCGISDIRVLEFDHLEPKLKTFGISKAVTNGYSWDIIMKEIEKCRILCANCHKIVTSQSQKWRKGRLGRVVRQDSAKVQTPVQIR